MTLTTIKILLGLEDDTQDQLLDTILQLVTTKTLLYCNRTDIPDALAALINEQVVKEYDSKYRQMQSTAAGSIKSESIGDYSVTYGEETGSGVMVELRDLTDYQNLLKKFRKLL